MRHFYYAPRVNLSESMTKLFSIIDEKKIKYQDLQTKFFNIIGKDDNELSSRAIYNWKDGKNFPELDKIFVLTRVLQQPAENFFVFDFDFVETEVPKKEKKERGTIIHTFRKLFHFEEENLAIDELQKKYPNVFEQISKVNSDYLFELSENKYYYYANNPTELFLEPSTDANLIKENFFNIMKKYNYRRKILKSILNLNSVQVISNWINLADRKPKTETLLNFARFLNMPFEDFCMVSYCAKKKKIFDGTQFEILYDKIHNREYFIEAYQVFKAEMERCLEEFRQFLDEMHQKEKKEWDEVPLKVLIRGFLADEGERDVYIQKTARFAYYLKNRMEEENLYDDFVLAQIDDFLSEPDNWDSSYE